MDAQQALQQAYLLQHARTHSTSVAPTDLPLEDLLLDGLSEDQVRCRPREYLNSIAWLLWHMARGEDESVSVLIADRAQVLDEADWPQRLKVARRDIGTGMTRDEVDELSESIDLGELRAYRSAVGRRTQEIIRELRPEVLQTTRTCTP